jgi:hypothetical protein
MRARRLTARPAAEQSDEIGAYANAARSVQHGAAVVLAVPIE